MKLYEVDGVAHIRESIRAENLRQAIDSYRRMHPQCRVESADAEDGSEGGSIIDYCEVCRRPIVEGDDYQNAGGEDADVYLCAEHKLTVEQAEQINRDLAADLAAIDGEVA